jgi:MFS family permease
MKLLKIKGYNFSSRFFPALGYRDFRILWAAEVFSHSSAWALIVARGALALTLTDSPLSPALVTYAAMIPSFVLSPFAGYLSDRFDRRKVLSWAYALNLIHSIVLAFLVVTGWVNVWYLIVLALFNGSFRTIQMSAGPALLPNTVDKKHIFNSVTLSQAAHQGSKFTGPLLILIILWVTGLEDWVFFASAVLYLIGMILVLNVRTYSTGKVMSGSGFNIIIQNMVAGISYIYKNHIVIALVLFVVAHCALTMSFESLFPVISRDTLGMEPGAGFMTGFGYLMVAFGGAAFLTIVSIGGIRTDKSKGRLLLMLGILSGITPIILGTAHNLPIAMLAAAGMGSSQAGFMALSQGMMQTLTPDSIRGRVMSIYSWHLLGFMATFNLINGSIIVVTPLTVSLILGLGGTTFIILTAISLSNLSMRLIYKGKYQPAIK